MKSRRWQCQNTTTLQQLQMKKVRLMTIWMHVKMLKIPKKIKTHKQQEKKTKKYESQVVKG